MSGDLCEEERDNDGKVFWDFELPVMEGCVVGRKWAIVAGAVSGVFVKCQGDFFFHLEIWFSLSWCDVD